MNNSNLYNEKELLAGVASGDEAAFAALFDRYKDNLYALTWSITRSLTIADDVLQEVFLKIWLRRAELSAVENFHGYLVVVTRRVILNELRRLNRIKNMQTSYQRDAEFTSFDEIIEQLQEKQYAEILHKGLQSLSDQQAAVFKLIKEQGHTREYAAQQLNLSPETVKKHLERAMRTMRAFLLSYIEDILLLLVCIHLFFKN